MSMANSMPTLFDVVADGVLEAKNDGLGVLYYASSRVLDGVHRICRAGHWRMVNSNFIQGSARVHDMQRAEVWPATPSVSHLFSGRLNAEAPPLDCFNVRVPVTHQDILSGVSNGFIAAGDVSPVLLGFFDSGYAGQTAYSVLRVNTPYGRACHTHRYGKNTPKPGFLVCMHRRVPCVRDGLLSIGLVNAMHGDGRGAVQVHFKDVAGDGGDVYDRVRTKWVDAYNNVDGSTGAGTADVYTRDASSTVSALAAYAAMQGWKVKSSLDSDENVVLETTFGGITLKLRFLYSATSGPRWMESISDSEVVDLSMTWEGGLCEYPSELALDYWVSGLARYVVAHRTWHGSLKTGGMHIVSPGHGLFPTLASAPVNAPTAPVNLVLAVERLQVSKQGAGGSYMYALGCAASSNGVLLTAGQAVDAELDDAVISGVKGAPRGVVSNMERRNVSPMERADLASLLRVLLNAARTVPALRIFTVGAERLTTSVEMAVMPDRAVVPNKSVVQELGASVGNVRDMASSASWGEVDGPGEVAILHMLFGGFLPSHHSVEDLRRSIGGLGGVEALIAGMLAASAE
jgi:hypothetical protein